ncbi:helix-turn-helix domain-containing protein [Kaistella sp. PBT33-4]|uniref:helix-turn-helix transcriptional regulator n=1 Tax=Kaistella sp. PBT33-4 TaxID=3032000 RepID=UPI0023D80561|nr:helix-turn-helix domain-containing protein [Kaistella sp. PBT33-4]MDF0718930.1 helix-turn-helix domain-containing protein [Kaistella sp. PBT33-4]
MNEEIIVTNHHSLRSIIREVVQEQLKEFANNFMNMIKTEDKILNRNEAMSYLKVSSSTLSRWTKQGIIPSHGCGARVYYKLSELEASLIALNCS